MDSGDWKLKIPGIHIILCQNNLFYVKKKLGEAVVIIRSIRYNTAKQIAD
jgi:hypothetical protein